jgi:hypothetical protein
MAELTAEKGNETLERLVQASDGAAWEWHVGVSRNAAERLAFLGMPAGPSAQWVQCESEEAARAVQEQLLRRGVQRDVARPATGGAQVYLFCAPNLTRFSGWLDHEAKRLGGSATREQKRQEWVAAVTRFIEKCRDWLAEVDPNGFLNLKEISLERAEQGLGRYEAPALVVEYEDVRVQVVPVGRNTARTLTLKPGDEVETLGRIDASNGGEKRLMHRAKVGGVERWYLARDRSPDVEVNQDVFLGLMWELLS